MAITSDFQSENVSSILTTCSKNNYMDNYEIELGKIKKLQSKYCDGIRLKSDSERHLEYLIGNLNLTYKLYNMKD